jgi:ribosome-binding factor A
MSRVNELIREVVAEEVGLLKDPAIGFVTVTGVDTSPDLRNAVVFYSVLGKPEEQSNTQLALDRAASHIQARLASQVRLKNIPRLHFKKDPAIDQGLRIEELLRDIDR